MSFNRIAAQMNAKVSSLGRFSTEQSSVISSLWARWFENMAYRLGTNADELYSAVSIDFQHCESIAQALGKEVDTPVGYDPRFKSLLSGNEVIESLTRINSTPVGEGGQSRFKSLLYHGLLKPQKGVVSGIRVSGKPEDVLKEYSEQEIHQHAVSDIAATQLPISVSPSIEQANKKATAFGYAHARTFILSDQEPYRRGKHDRAIQAGAIRTTLVEAGESIERANHCIEVLEACENTHQAIRVLLNFCRNNAELDDAVTKILRRSLYDIVQDHSHGNAFQNASKEAPAQITVINPAIIEVAEQEAYDSPLYTQPPKYKNVLFQNAGIYSSLANIPALTLAKSLQQKGASKEEILKSTGWFQWVDGKWRFEIDDSASTIDISKFSETKERYDVIARTMKGGTTRFVDLNLSEQLRVKQEFVPSIRYSGTLGSILDHPTLFSHYPELKDLTVDLYVNPSLKQESGYLEGTLLNFAAPNTKSLLVGITHEIQHRIQDIEGFSRGGNPDMYTNLPAETKAFYKRQTVDIKLLLDYAKTRNTDLKSAAKALASIPIMPSVAMMTETHTQSQIEEYLRQKTIELRDPQTRYENLAGEYEARDTESRLLLKASDRLKIFPLQKEMTDHSMLEVRLKPSEYAILKTTAYHGTGASFDAFDERFIGQGEGQQAYGWGFYFSSEKQVAEFYRSKLSAPENTRPDQEAIAKYQGEWKKTVARWEAENEGLPDYLKELDGERLFAELDVIHAKMVEETLARRSASGSMLTVEIPDKEELIQYHAPINQQSRWVTAKLVESGIIDANHHLPIGLTVNKTAQGYCVSRNNSVLSTGDSAESAVRQYHNKYPNGGEQILRALCHDADTALHERTGATWGLIQNNPKRLEMSLDQVAAIRLAAAGISGLRYQEKNNPNENYVIWDSSVIDVQAVHTERQARVEPKGAVSRDLEANNFLVMLNDKSGMDTLAHEVCGHVFLDVFKQCAESPVAPTSVKEEWRKLKNYLGVTGSTIPEHAHERWANATVAYLKYRDFSAEADATMQRMQRWLGDQYSEAKIAHVAIPEGIKEILDTMYGVNQRDDLDFDTLEETLNSLQTQHQTKGATM